MTTSLIDFPSFSGENEQSVARSLRVVCQKMPISIISHRWLVGVNACLEREIAKWADNIPMIRRMLADDTIERTTKANITKFKGVLII